MKKVLSLAVLMTILVSTASMADNAYSMPTLSNNSKSDDDPYRRGCLLYVQGDTVNAAKCFEKSAKAGNTEGIYMYGLFKMGGFGGVKVNEKAGLRMVHKAAENGVTNALYFLGEIYETGEYGCPKDKSVALDYYRKASQAGSFEGHVACGNSYWDNGDTIMAIKYWSKAVEETTPYSAQDEQRDALAQISYNLGWFCQYGIQQDIYEAIDYYQQSILYGNTKDAAFQLGLICLDGANGSEPDMKTAVYYFKIAAASGHPEVCVYVGDILRMSDSEEQALLYYLEGAKSGNQNAMCSLAELYYEREEYESAVYWASQCPDNVSAVFLLGCICYMQQDFEQAKYYWQQCVFRFHYADAITMLKCLDSGEFEWDGINKGLVDI